MPIDRLLNSKTKVLLEFTQWFYHFFDLIKDEKRISEYDSAQIRKKAMEIYSKNKENNKYKNVLFCFVRFYITV